VGPVEPAGMPRANNGAVTLAYEVSGPPDAPTVVLVEGLGYGRWMWNWQVDALADGYETVVWDNRGTGDSDAPEGPYTIGEMAGDLEAVLDDHGAESAHVVGASMGGMIAQEYALGYDRAASLALLCTSPGGAEAVETPPEVRERILSVPEELDKREAIRYKMAPALSDGFAADNEELVERIVDWRLESDADDPAREAQAAAVAAFDAGDRLDGLDSPTLIMHGTDDRVLPVGNAELLHGRIPGSELELFEDGPHLFFIERAEEVNRRLLSFLGEHAGEGTDV